MFKVSSTKTKGFCVRWWREQNKKKKKSVQRLVASGQLEFM